jgi:hypothetical protein
MQGAVDTRVASGAVVLVWLAALAAEAGLRPWSAPDVLLVAALAVWAYLIHEPAPTPRIAIREAFGLPLLVGALGGLGVLIGRNPDAVSWMFVVLTYFAAGRLKDLIGDRRVYVRLPGPKT